VAAWRLNIAYTLAAAGYEAERANHHYRMIHSLEFTIGVGAAAIRELDVFRKKRNITEGWIHLKKNQPEPAIALFGKLVQKQPEHSTYRYHLGMALSQKGDTIAAAEQLRKALECKPSEEENQKIRQLLERIGQ
jgi:tetratricopeptide (TPR) repeat protein